MTSPEPFRVRCVVGARPNFMKIAPIMRAFDAEPALQGILLHTGQHDDEAMKAACFEQLSIPEPDVDLGVGSASHALQTAEIMRRFEPELDRPSKAVSNNVEMQIRQLPACSARSLDDLAKLLSQELNDAPTLTGVFEAH